MKLLVIGGSDAGISAALRAREMDQSVATMVILRDAYPNYSICGIPFLISGETADWRSLAHRSLAEIQETGIKIKENSNALRLNPETKEVLVKDISGQSEWLKFDRLIIATGAQPVVPPLEGLNQPGVFQLRWIEDALALGRFIESSKPRRATVIGAGYIGLEMADALTRLGIEVSLIQRSAQVMKTLEPELGGAVEIELERHGVRVFSGRPPKIIQKNGDTLTVLGPQGLAAEGDLVLVVTGVRPQSDLAADAGAAIGIKTAIKVDRRMQTSLKDVFAAGDCVETWHRLLESSVYLPLGTTAHKQGHIAGENAAGGQAVFAGSLGTQVVKVFDLVIARSGLLDREALEAGFQPLSVTKELWDHKVYYPGAKKLIIRLTGDRQNGRLLGAQIVGPYGAEISKRIDILAAGLYAGLKIQDLPEMDLSYTPPLSSPWDPIQATAQSWLDELARKQ
jgi:NADPH-dependent 2,4-dienoyl-CoA reductase/sulfur reductase-like enzyme